MRKSVFSAALSVATEAVAARHQQHHPLLARDTVDVGPSGVCPPVPTTIVELQPVFYQEFFPYDTVIVPFRNGAEFSVSNAPTDVVLSSVLTRTYTSTSTSPSESLSSATSQAGPSSSSSERPSSASSSEEAATTTAPSVSSTPDTTAVATTSAAADLFIGQGLPAGVLDDLPDQSFIFLAFTDIAGPQTTNAPSPTDSGGTDLNGTTTALSSSSIISNSVDVASPVAGRLRFRQAGSGLVTASPAIVADLTTPTSQAEAVGQESCDGATPLLLTSGSLKQFGRAVAKQSASVDALLGFLESPNGGQVNATFSLNNGVLEWVTPDVGPATFYSCDGLLYAGFISQFPSGCQQVLVGAIAGRACSQRVERSRAVESTFTAPVEITTSVVATTPAGATTTDEATTPAPSPTSATTGTAVTTTLASSDPSGPVAGSFVTFTVAWQDSASTITAPFTSTAVQPSGSAPGTVIVYTPFEGLPNATPRPTASDGPYVTITSAWTGTSPISEPVTSTLDVAFVGATTTIVVYTPAGPPTAPSPSTTTIIAVFVTTTIQYSGSDSITVPITSTLALPSGSEPGTVAVITPAPDPLYDTIEVLYTGTATITEPITTTVILPSNGTPGTVEIQRPGVYATRTEAYTGSGVLTAPLTSTVSPADVGITGLVVVYTPFASASATTTAAATFVTITVAYTGSGIITAPVTVTAVQPSGGVPGTIEVQTLNALSSSTEPGAVYVTNTVAYTGVDIITAPITVTVVQPSGGAPGMVEVQTPAAPSTSSTTTFPSASFVTITQLYTGATPITSPFVSTIFPTGTSPGTVVVYTPAPALTTTTPADYFVTITQAYTGYVPITSAIASTIALPSNTLPGTVVIFTPVQASTTTTPPSSSEPRSTMTTTLLSSSTEPRSTDSTTLPSSSTEPISTTTAAAVFVTITVAYSGPSTITGPLTSTAALPTGTIAGTIIVYTISPLATSNSSATIVGSSTSTTTAPADVFVTIFQPYTDTVSISLPLTSTAAVPSGGLPGTIVVLTRMTITSTTVSTTASSTSTFSTSSASPIFIPPPPKCGNDGLGFAVQNHSFYNTDAPKFTNVGDLTYFHTAAPLAASNTTRVGFAAWGNTNYYGKTPIINGEYKAVNHRFYLYSPQSGTFTFAITGSDDITFVWIGNKAFTQYTRANRDIEQNFNGLGVKYPFPLVAGVYYPVRILTVNGQGPGIFNLVIESPGGLQVLGPNTNGSSDYIVQRSCDGTSGPAWPPFGAEVTS